MPSLTTLKLQSMLVDDSQTITLRNASEDLEALETYVHTLEDLDVSKPFYITVVGYRHF